MQCIIFTDTNRLAEKYRVSQQEVMDILERNLLQNQDVEFLLLDAVDYKEELGGAPTWTGYKSILVDFMAGMGLQSSIKLGVFVIGGDDVIPMPRIASPLSSDELLQADILYCFREDDIEGFDPDQAICNIGRLPMENGLMPRSLTDDLQSYFNLSGMMLSEGIDVCKVLMTSTQSWLPASSEMVRGLPVIEPQTITNATTDTMYTSPSVGEDDKYVESQYRKDLSEADLLMFNLHGSDVHRASSFYGEGYSGHNNPEAFSIDMIRECNARIFNTVACYGGRYVGYNRTESMLLSSIYGGGIMLYAGSCVCALGRSGQHHVAANDILKPAGYSETFMKLYSVYLFSGITAGEAFLRAKCDYFNTCTGMDMEEGALATVYMFNLYGMPILSVNQQNTVVEEARGVKRVNVHHIAKSPIFSKDQKRQTDTYSILEQIRGTVDRNLQSIRNQVQTRLYEYWGLNPSDLKSIDKFSSSSFRDGYRFEYVSKGSVVDTKSWAFADNKGNIVDVIHLK